MDFTTTLSNSFFRDELGRALSECGFGILAWILDASVDDIAEEPAQATATATVTLLSDEAEQGPEIGVKLTIKGYCVYRGDLELPRISFETLDDMLCAVSPVFQRRRTKLLYEKLEDVAKARTWND
ncbi:MAG: hypothetical protein CYPHOPRED_005030 [Cyphobasidiales sp. Tagirdzhanova-0007]|nr:MAG: hypothetical protein CYPHOPRED_005030 [Cyphobasidiales sp. Tagirdzhanova-0007]